MTLAQIIGDYDNPNSLGSRFRRQRSAPLRAMIEQVFAERDKVSILDVGGTEYYWKIFPLDFLQTHRVNIVLLNLGADLKPVNHSEMVQVIEGDGCALQFADDDFDICHSNSVIEHVGSWNRKVAYAREVTRVAPRYFHQTPSFWFPWEPHFGMPIYHWLPEPMRLAIACRRKLGWTMPATSVDDGMQTVEHASLLDRRMFSYLFPDAKIISERLVGLTKSFIAIK
jgi:hypothetical protein